MDSNEIENTNKPQPSGNKLSLLWQWLSASNTRVAGLLMLGLAMVLMLALLVLISQQSADKKKTIPSPQASPATGQFAQTSQIPLPSLTADLTKDWQVIDNRAGFKLKYPPKSKLLPSLNEASSSSRIQVIATDSATLIVEVSVEDKPLLDIVNLIRDKNKNQQILTKPISILIAGYEGYEWYFKGAKFTILTQTLSVKDTKNRVIQFNKHNTHYIILSTFDDTGEQLLSTLTLTP